MLVEDGSDAIHRDTRPFTAPTGRAWWEQTLYGLAIGGSFLLALSVFVPLLQPFGPVAPDWLLGLDVAHLKGWAAGSQVTFTYGPLGFAWLGYFPGTFGELVLVWTLVGGGMWLVLWGTPYAGENSRWWRVASIAVLLVAAAGDNPSLHDSRLLLPSVVLLGYCFRSDHRLVSWQKSLLLLVMAVAGLIKFTYLVAGCAAAAAVTVDEFLHRRKPYTLWLYLGMYCVGWCILGQSLSQLPVYAASSIDITGGYAEAMSLTRPGEKAEIREFWLPASLLVVLVAWATPRRFWWRRWLHAGALAGILLLIFRAGYVRHDEHEIIATGTLLPAVAFYWIVFRPRAARKPGQLAAWHLGLVLSAYAASLSYARFAGQGLVDRSLSSLRSVGSELAEAARIVAGQTPTVATEYTRSMQAAATQNPLPHVDGTVDLWPLLTHLVLANHLDYHPRPSLQSYAVYTPKLALTEAAHFRGANAPRHVFFGVAALDGRMPTMNSGLAWLQVLSRYEIAGTVREYLHLRLRAQSRSLEIRPLSSFVSSTRTDIPVPPSQGAPVWVKIRMTPTWSRRLVSALYKPEPVFLILELADGKSRQFRLIPGSAESGFLLWPVVESIADLRWLMDRPPASASPPTVTSLRVRDCRRDDRLGCYQRRIEVSFSAVVLGK